MSAISPLRRWALAVGLVAAAYLATAAVVDIDRAPLFIFFVAAVLLAAFFGDRWSGMLAVGFSLAINCLILAHEDGQWSLPEAEQIRRLLAFAAVSVIGVGIVHRLQLLLERERVLNALVHTNPSLTVVTDSRDASSRSTTSASK